MSEGLAKKKRIRAGHKASATRMLKEVDTLLAAEPLEMAKLSQLKLTIEEKLGTLKQLDNEILDLLEEEEALVREIEEADNYKEGIYQAIVRIEQCCVSMATPSTPVRTPTPPASTSRATHDEVTIPAATAATNRVKLPKLTLRPFNGDITNWTTFWDSYESAIHNNRELSDINKFNYLKSLLEKSAYDSIAGLSLTAVNYAEAIAILKKRFGNKQQIITKHMDILLSAEAVTSANNLKGVRRLYDLVESNIRSLKSLGVAPESYGSLLSSVLLNKMPQEIQLIVSRNVADADWTKLDAMLKAVEEEIEARERMTANLTKQPKKPTVDKSQATATALLSGSNPSCCYCQQSHSPVNCKVVTRVDARKQILRRSGRCFGCLRRGHISRECRSSNNCTRCGGRHHTSICSKGTSSRQSDSSRNAPATEDSSRKPPATQSGLNPSAAEFTSTTTTSLYVDVNKTILLQTAQALVFNPHSPESPLQVRVILDSGSQRSYVTKRVRDALSLVPENYQHVSIMTFGSGEGASQLVEVVKLSMKLHGNEKKELTLFAVPHICEPLSSEPVTLCVDMYEHLSNLDLADSIEGSDRMAIDMLIGSDYYWELATGKTIRGEGGPIAIHTKLGWVLSGPVATQEEASEAVSLVTTHSLRVDCVPETEKLDLQLRSFWELESLGVQCPDSSVYEEFSSTIRFKNGRYEVSLPWKDSQFLLSNNYQLCLRRLQGLMRRLRQDKNLLKEYDSIIQCQLQQGIVEVVEPREEESEGIHYLPHHAVIRQDKETTKVRIVYDASARSDEGLSLNDCLFTGQKFDQKILDILIRFRSYKVALTADIEKAFLMVSIVEKDRDVLRFLWFDDALSTDPNLVVLRFARVVFGVSASPFLLNATLRHHVESFAVSNPHLVKVLIESTYVDDIVFGADSEECAFEMYQQSKDLLRAGGFNLRKFATNLPTLQEKIDEKESLKMSPVEDKPEEKNPEDKPEEKHEEDESYSKSMLGSSQKMHTGEQKVLGVRWRISSDQIAFSFDSIFQLAHNLEPTKRNVVSVAGKFYDPLGFVSPVVIPFKVLFQELCQAKLEWDQPLTGKLLKKWQSLLASLREAQPISIPRCYLSDVKDEVKKYSLCGFCDASNHAYAAVVYLMIETESGCYLRFVVSKTRVAPVQKQTIPRLELLSALLMARLMDSVISSLSTLLPLSQPRCFTDSMVALFWIQGVEKQWKPFVQNRVNEIRKLLPVNCWNHCSGKDNPADIPSRGLTPLELSVNMLWRHGPSWLDTAEGDSSESDSSEITMPEECTAEMKVKDKSSVHSLLTTDVPVGLGKIIKCEDFSTFGRLCRVTAYVLRFVKILKTRIQSGVSDVPTRPLLSAEEITEAKKLWIIESQITLMKDKKFATWKKQFGLFADETGIWRCGGRLTNANLAYSVMHPILLHKNHYLTTLIIQNAHERVGHDGVKETLTELRSKYWVVKGRSLVKFIIHRCQVCRRIEGQPYHPPPPPPLPLFRVKESPPFSYTGVDFAGPLFVRGPSGSSTKVWICLYTCCVVRAVHLDIVPDMSTQTFICSLKRFAARRGLPRKIVSDNGKTFKAAAKLLKTVMNHDEVQQYLSGVGVDWIFNLERAPWWGGVFERMVRSTKRCLKKMIGQAKLTYDELLTAVTEVEAIVNSRPLSFISSDDLEEPLTPSHLLIGRRALSLPDNLCYSEDDDTEVTPAILSKRLKYLSTILDKFWKRWKNEYLLELRDSHRYKSGDHSANSISIGDIVVVYNDSKHRGFWKLARVEELITGRDEQVRGAVLRVHSKDNHCTTLRRPLQHIYPLEVHCVTPGAETDVEIESSNASPPNEDVHDEQDEAPRRSTRAAALKARDRIRACVLELDSD